MNKSENSRVIKFLNAFCSLSLLMTLVYAFFAGFNYIAIGILVVSLIAVATPSFIASNGIIDALIGTIMAIVEGVVLIAEAIVSSIASLFSC